MASSAIHVAIIMEATPLAEQLLLAQAVHQVATTPPDWAKVSSLMRAHPFVRTTESAWGEDRCSEVWTALMKAHALEQDPAKPARNLQLALAQKLYAARLSELHDQIQGKEQRFR